MEVFDPTDTPCRLVHDKIPISDDRIVRADLNAPFIEGAKVCLRRVDRWESANIGANAPVAESNPSSRWYN